jgi:hypothetical protein
MAYRITGQYVGTCECQLVCGCAMNAQPTGRNNTCTGMLVFHIAEGSFESVDLSGINVAMMYYSPGKVLDGNLKLGIVVDESASQEQTDALTTIFSGKAGGVFGEFVPLIGEFLPTERAPVSYSDGEKPSAAVGASSISVELMRNAEGKPTQISNVMVPFADPYMIGEGSGHVEAMGLSYDSRYGEVAESFEYAS